MSSEGSYKKCTIAEMSHQWTIAPFWREPHILEKLLKVGSSLSSVERKDTREGRAREWAAVNGQSANKWLLSAYQSHQGSGGIVEYGEERM